MIYTERQDLWSAWPLPGFVWLSEFSAVCSASKLWSIKTRVMRDSCWTLATFSARLRLGGSLLGKNLFLFVHTWIPSK